MKTAQLIVLAVIIMLTSTIYSQEAFSVKSSNDSSYIFVGPSGKVAIDTSTTLGTLTVNGNDGIIAAGTYGSGTALNLGIGAWMMWYPKKAAFRAGYIDPFGNNLWYDSNIGNFSTAFGYNNEANGVISFAAGEANTASGKFATVFGNKNTSSGEASTAMGDNTTASGNFTSAMGSYVSTNSNSGSFIIGDGSTTTTTNSTAANQMMMRFDGGYIFYTSSNLSSGVQLANGGNAWSTISDSTKKYAFLPVNGESILQKISKFNLRTWSYRGQDSTKFRHYGPMAQEFFNAFGHDKYGIAGNDTTINQADFMGINLIAIQALEKENNKQKLEIYNQKKDIEKLKQEIKKRNAFDIAINKRVSVLEQKVEAMNSNKVASVQK